jgi:tetratricopeptide (TPR) repeat protein
MYTLGMARTVAVRRQVRRRRLKGVAVNPASIRQAREEAGLSLAAVAGSEVTRSAIHNVETGKTRPSLPVLEMIARRTGKPIEAFLAQAGSSPISEAGAAHAAILDELERKCLAEDFQGAIAAGERALASPTDDWSRAHIHFYLGQAYARLPQPENGLQHLRRARALYESLGDRLMTVECLDWEAVAVSLQQDVRALDLAERALSLCEELDPCPLELKMRILGHLANVHVHQHNWSRAVDCYQRALEAGGSLRDLGQLARMHDGLSVASQEMGDQAGARQHSAKALALYTLLHNERAVAAAENNLGLILLRQGQLDDAERHLRRSLSLCESLNYELVRAAVVHSLGELHLAEGRLEEAERAAEESMAAARELGQPSSLAAAHQLLGMIAAARGNAGQTDADFQRALSLFAEAGSADRLRECRAVYAQILSNRGDLAGAAEQWRLAAGVPLPEYVMGFGRERASA